MATDSGGEVARGVGGQPPAQPGLGQASGYAPPGGAPPPDGPPPSGPGPSLSDVGQVAADAARPDNDGEHKRRRRLRGVFGFVSDRFIPLLIAVLGLLAALATTWGAIKTADANDLAESNTSLEEESGALDAQLVELEAKVKELTGERDELQQTVDDLREQQRSAEVDDPDDPTSPPVTSGPRSPTSTVLRQTGDDPLEVGSGYSIDLDSDAANWGVKDGSSGDLYFYNSSPPYLGTREIALMDHVPTEEECENATVRQNSLQRDQTRQGVQMCMLTNQDRWAYVRIAGLDADAGIISLDLTVWE